MCELCEIGEGPAPIKELARRLVLQELLKSVAENGSFASTYSSVCPFETTTVLMEKSTGSERWFLLWPVFGEFSTFYT
jgi:hypothetical protein